MSVLQPRLLLAATALGLLGGLACSEGGTDEAPVESRDTSRVVATLAGEQITLDEVDALIKEQLLARETGGRETELYLLRVEAVKEIVNRRAVEQHARTLGMTLDEFLEAEAARLPPVTDEEVAAFYEANRMLLRNDPGLELLRPVLRRKLEQDRRNKIVEPIIAAISPDIDLRPPRLDVTDIGPSLGPADAPVTIIEFSDYECPFCLSAEPIVKQLLAQYPDEVRFVFRHNPLPPHPNARPAARAAVCADAQGRFWEYHEKLFANQRDLSPELMRELAAGLSLDLAAFDACIASPETEARVARDAIEAQSLGLESTPAFFVNGLFFRGVQSAALFEQVIESELRGEERS